MELVSGSVVRSYDTLRESNELMRLVWKHIVLAHVFLSFAQYSYVDFIILSGLFAVFFFLFYFI